MTDITRRGGTTYSTAQMLAVLGVLQALSPGRSIGCRALASRLGMEGRTVRAILSDCDGVSIVLGGGGNGGYRLAFSSEDADRLTARLRSQAQRIQERLERRGSLAQLLIASGDLRRSQLELFADGRTVVDGGIQG